MLELIVPTNASSPKAGSRSIEGVRASTVRNVVPRAGAHVIENRIAVGDAVPEKVGAGVAGPKPATGSRLVFGHQDVLRVGDRTNFNVHAAAKSGLIDVVGHFARVEIGGALRVYACASGSDALGGVVRYLSTVHNERCSKGHEEARAFIVVRRRMVVRDFAALHREQSGNRGIANVDSAGGAARYHRVAGQRAFAEHPDQVSASAGSVDFKIAADSELAARCNRDQRRAVRSVSCKAAAGGMGNQGYIAARRDADGAGDRYIAFDGDGGRRTAGTGYGVLQLRQGLHRRVSERNDLRSGQGHDDGPAGLVLLGSGLFEAVFLCSGALALFKVGFAASPLVGLADGGGLFVRERQCARAGVCGVGRESGQRVPRE